MGGGGVGAACGRRARGPGGGRGGRRGLRVGGSLGGALAMVLLVPAASVPAVIGARLVLGVGEAAYFIGVTSAVQDLAPPHRRGEATSYFTVTLYTGLAIGPGLGEWLYETANYDRAFTVAAILGLVPLLFANAAPGRPDDPLHGPLLRRRLHPSAIRPGIALFICLFGYAAFLAVSALHAATPAVSPRASRWSYANLAKRKVHVDVDDQQVLGRNMKSTQQVRAGLSGIVHEGAGLGQYHIVPCDSPPAQHRFGPTLT